LQGKLQRSEKELIRMQLMLQEKLPSLAMLFGQVRRHDLAIQFLLARLRAVQGLPSKWRTEFVGSDAAERCASDLEALVIQPEAQGKHKRTLCICATILSERRLSVLEDGKSAALQTEITQDAISKAERIMHQIDARWPSNVVPGES
jgi:hypothetical protein